MKDYMKKHYEQEARFEIAKYIDAAINNNEVEIKSIQDELLIEEGERQSWRSNEYLNHQIEIYEVQNEILKVLLKEVMK